jgi:hypothetical protein
VKLQSLQLLKLSFYLKYKLASAIRLFVNPFSGLPAALFHLKNSLLIVGSFGFTFTFFSKVELFKLPTPQL